MAVPSSDFFADQTVNEHGQRDADRGTRQPSGLLQVGGKCSALRYKNRHAEEKPHGQDDHNNASDDERPIFLTHGSPPISTLRDTVGTPQQFWRSGKRSVMKPPMTRA